MSLIALSSIFAAEPIPGGFFSKVVTQPSDEVFEAEIQAKAEMQAIWDKARRKIDKIRADLETAQRASSDRNH